MEELPTNRDEKNAERTLVRNGYIPEEQKERLDKLLNDEYLMTFVLNEPLSFADMTSFNTWFVMHPEKICGTEVITTSREFPITIKGTKEDIIRTIKGNNNNNVETPVLDFERDTKDIEIETESEKTINRFGKSDDALTMTVAEFDENYFNQYERLQEFQKPLEEQAVILRNQLKEVGRDKEKRKEISEKLNEVNGKLIKNKNDFENDWLEYIFQLKNNINKIIANKGLPTCDENEMTFADDILIAITERPGTEIYWQTPINQVIEKEMEYYLKQQQSEKSDNNNNTLELEALAIEVELQLLNV